MTIMTLVPVQFALIFAQPRQCSSVCCLRLPNNHRRHSLNPLITYPNLQEQDLTLACRESFRPPQIRQERTGLKPVKKAVSKRGRPQQWNPDKQEQKIITLHSHRGKLELICLRNGKKSSLPVPGMRNRGPLKDLNDSKLINFIPFKILNGPLFHKLVTSQDIFLLFLTGNWLQQVVFSNT